MPPAHQGLQTLNSIVGNAGAQGEISPHYYQYIPGYGYFLMTGLPGDSSYGQVAANGANGQGAEVVRESQKGCKCLKEWSLSGTPCENYCCNPDNAAGDWCFVEDQNCEGDTWGLCSASPTLLQTSSNRTKSEAMVRKTRKLQMGFLQKRHDDVEGSECDCES